MLIGKSLSNCFGNCQVCFRDILAKQFEIILTMEGITPETGNTIQVLVVRFRIWIRIRVLDFVLDLDKDSVLDFVPDLDKDPVLDFVPDMDKDPGS